MALLDRLCDLGRMRRISRAGTGDATELTYRDLSTLDVVTLIVPARQAEPGAGPATQQPPGTTPQEATQPDRRLLEAVAASSRRNDLAGALEHLVELLCGVYLCERVSLNISREVGVAHPATLAELDDILRTSGGASIAPERVRRQVEESGQALHVPDLGADPAFAKRPGARARGSAIVAPLRAEGYVYGVLEAWRSAPRAFEPRTVAAAAFIAEFAAGLIRRRLEVEEMVFIDQVTQIHNRRYFEEQLEREMERSRRTGNAMALLIADLDDFKRVNDTLGHTAGDSVLRQAARLLTENARQVDIVARYGGEEFSVILPDVTAESARAAAERMLWTIAEHRFATGSEATPWWNLTVSVGGALFPVDAQTRAELVDRADRVALYAAKRAGKNRVVFWSDSGTRQP